MMLFIYAACRDYFFAISLLFTIYIFRRLIFFDAAIFYALPC